MPEIPILILLIAIAAAPLAALIWESEAEDQLHAVRHNLFKLRDLIDEYRRDHGGQPPADLAQLTESSNLRGIPSGGPELSEDFPIGPYLQSIPENPLSQASVSRRNAVRHIDHHPVRENDISDKSYGGWLYNPQTGGVWVDHEQYFGL